MTLSGRWVLSDESVWLVACASSIGCRPVVSVSNTISRNIYFPFFVFYVEEQSTLLPKRCVDCLAYWIYLVVVMGHRMMVVYGYC